MNDQEADCYELLSTNDTTTVLEVLAGVSSVSLSMNILTVSVALYLKVYKHFAHRLAMYLVCSSILTNIIHISQFALLPCLNLDEEKLCNNIGPLRQYFMSVELLFAVCFTFHLFCLTVLQRSFKYSEHIYVFVATVGPFALLVWIPYCWDDYRYGIDVAWCGIKSQNETAGFYEDKTDIGLHFGIWYGPVLFLQCINAVEVIVILIAICYRLRSLKRDEEVLINRVNANEKALKEVVPLVVYILIFFILTVVPFAHRLYLDKCNIHLCFAIVHVICDGLWGFNCSFAQLTHLYINRKLTRKQNKKRLQSGFTRLNGLNDTPTSYTELSTDVNTHFTAVEESDVDPFRMQ